MKQILLPVVFRFLLCFSQLSLICPEFVNLQAEPVKIGLLTSLSGPLAEYGIAIKNGAQLALEENSLPAGGISLLVEDYQSDSKHAVAAYTSLMATANPQIIFVFGTTASQAVVPKTVALGRPILTSSIDPAISKGSPLVMRTASDVSKLIQPVSLLIKKRAVKKLALLVTEWSYTE